MGTVTPRVLPAVSAGEPRSPRARTDPALRAIRPTGGARPTPISPITPIPPPAPAAPPAPTAPAASAAMPRRRRPHGWTVMIVPPATTARGVRTRTVRPWQLRMAVVSSLALLLGAAIGGAWLAAAAWGAELAAVEERLADSEARLGAVGDSLRALRTAVTMNAAPAVWSEHPVSGAAAPVRSSSPAGASRGTSSAPTPARRRTSSIAAPVTRPADGVVLPVSGRISSGFTLVRRHPILRLRRPHLGADIVAPSGSPIHSPAAGHVRRVGRQIGYGLVVEIDHGDGVTTRYAHCRSALVESGQTVSAGQAIATVGATGLATGPHLHYEVRVNGRAVDPMRHVFAVPPRPVAVASDSAPAPLAEASIATPE